MRQSLVALVAVLLYFSLASCATITDGSTQEMSFQSNPEDVVVTVTKRVAIARRNTCGKMRCASWEKHPSRSGWIERISKR